MKNQKAQAAIEFLSTYGWALLVIALILVALGWLGVFTPQNTISQFCQFPINSFQCNDVRIGSVGAGGYLRVLDLTNNFGKRVYICGTLGETFICSAQQPNPTTGLPPGITAVTACGDPIGMPLSRILESGQRHTYDVSLTICSDETGSYNRPAPVGSKFTGKIYVRYSYEGEKSGAPRIATADITTTVQPY